jgi:predicted dinucleotide-binding enzyme
MNIGILGIGFVGAPLAKHLVAAGHQVKVTNTRPPDELARMARELGAAPATLPEVGQDVDVLVSSLNFKVLADLPQELKDLFQSLPADVIVADTGNYMPFRDGKIEALEQGQVEGLWVAEQLGRPIIRFLNNLLAETITDGGTPPGTPGRIAVALAGDDARAKQVLSTLCNDIGFDAVDAGSLADSWRQQPGTPAYCTELTVPELTEALALANKDVSPQERDWMLTETFKLPEGPHTPRAVKVAINRQILQRARQR